MEGYILQIAETGIAILGFLITRLLVKRLIIKVGNKFRYQSARIKITDELVGFLLFIILIIMLMIIWGVDQSRLLLFLSTILTVLGVAFFAQWSIISNITATLIIFFKHPIKIGDSLSIIDKDYQIEGELCDIGIFFLIIKTKDGKNITIPSIVFMQKLIVKEDPA